MNAPTNAFPTPTDCERSVLVGASVLAFADLPDVDRQQRWPRRVHRLGLRDIDGLTRTRAVLD